MAKSLGPLRQLVRLFMVGRLPTYFTAQGSIAVDRLPLRVDTFD